MRGGDMSVSYTHLIGPNGAGKTTVFNLLTGVYKPDKGSIVLDGKNITGRKTTEINQDGIARTFQNIRLFKELSVLDNVKAGLHNHYKYSTITGIFRLPRYYQAVSYPHLACFTPTTSPRSQPRPRILATTCPL